MIVYCISGLGADERVFARLQLQAELRHIYWLRPQAGESIQSYCERLAEQVDASRPFVLLGVSFGGVLAQYLAQVVPAERVVIISSVSDHKQLPAVARLPLVAAVLRLLRPSWLVPPRRLMAWLFGIEGQQERRLFYQILKDTDPYFLHWALLILLKLRQIPAVPGLVQLHGTADKLIPCPESPLVRTIRGGGHFMIYSRAEEASELLEELLAGHED